MERNWQTIKETDRNEGRLISGTLDELNRFVDWEGEKCGWLDRDKERKGRIIGDHEMDMKR